MTGGALSLSTNPDGLMNCLTAYIHLFNNASANLNSRKTNFNQFVVTFGLIIRISPALAGLVGLLPMVTRGDAVKACSLWD